MIGMHLTIVGLCAFGLLLAVSVWQVERPRKDTLRPRWIPWKVLIFIAGGGILYLGIHLFHLLRGG